MDDSQSTSSRHRDRHYNGEHEHHRHKRHRHKNRSRSRSISDRESSPTPKRSVVYRNGKTASEYEIRIQALSTQLAMANSQLVTTETALETLKKTRNQAETRYFSIQQEKLSLERRNGEIIQVMKTLEAGVEILQKDKLELTVANEALTAKTDAQERNLNLVNEQITSLNDRNSTLSRKCVEILESGKETKEKVANYERELENLRPHCESLQQQLNSLTEENKRQAAQIANFETREFNWIKVKNDLEKRSQELTERAERSERYVKQKLSMAIDESFSRMVGKKGEHDYVSKMKVLQNSFDILRSTFQVKLTEAKEKLERLEKKCIQQQQESHKTEHSKQQIVSSINIIKDPTTQTTGIKGKGKEADSPAAAASDNNNTASTITSTSSGDVEEDDPDIVILPINNK